MLCSAPLSGDQSLSNDHRYRAPLRRRKSGARVKRHHKTLAQFLDEEMSWMYIGSRESEAWSTYTLANFIKEEDPAGEGISQGTAWRLLEDPGRIPRDTTLKKIAYAFGVPITDIRELAGRSVGEVRPFSWPAEFDQLTYSDRDALMEMGWKLLGKKAVPVNRRSQSITPAR